MEGIQICVVEDDETEKNADARGLLPEVLRPSPEMANSHQVSTLSDQNRNYVINSQFSSRTEGTTPLGQQLPYLRGLMQTAQNMAPVQRFQSEAIFPGENSGSMRLGHEYRGSTNSASALCYSHGSLSVDDVPPSFYASSHMDRIETGLPDYLIKQSLLLLGEAIVTNDSETIRYLSNVLKTEAKPNGRPIQRLLCMCITGLQMRMICGNRERSFAGMLESGQATQEAWSKFTDKTPHIRLGYETACGLIMGAVKGCEKLHIIDFGSWPQLWIVFLKKLAARAERVPHVRLTIVLTASSSSLLKANYPAMASEINIVAAELRIPLRISSLHLHMEHIHAGLFQCRDDEALAVNCNLYLHQLPDASVLRFSPRDKLIEAIHDLNPKIIRIVDFGAELNTNFFLSRLKNAIDYYESVFTGIELSFGEDVAAGRILEASYYQQQIINVIACEGLNRWFRPESSESMLARFHSHGLGTLPYNEDMVEAMNSIIKDFPLFTLRFSDGCAELYFDSISQGAYFTLKRME